MVTISDKSLIRFEKVDESFLQSLHEVATLAYYQAYFGAYTYEELKPYLESFFSEEKLNEDISQPYLDYFVVRKPDRAIGFSRVNHKASFANGIRKPEDNSIELHKLYLLQKYTGRGIGTRFMNMMSNYYCESGYSTLYSTVWSLSPKALNFYKKQGFELVGQTEYDYAGRNNIDYVLKKSLIPFSDRKP